MNAHSLTDRDSSSDGENDFKPLSRQATPKCKAFTKSRNEEASLKRSASTKVTRRERQTNGVLPPLKTVLGKRESLPQVLPDINLERNLTASPQRLIRGGSLKQRNTKNILAPRLSHLSSSPGSSTENLRSKVLFSPKLNSPSSLPNDSINSRQTFSFWDDMMRAGGTPTPFSESWDESRSFRGALSNSIRLDASRGHGEIRSSTAETTPQWLLDLKGKKHVSTEEVEKLAALLNSCKTTTPINTLQESPTNKEPPSYMKTTESHQWKRRRNPSFSKE